MLADFMFDSNVTSYDDRNFYWNVLYCFGKTIHTWV